MALKSKWQKMETDEILAQTRVTKRALLDEIDRTEGRQAVETASDDVPLPLAPVQTLAAAPPVDPELVAHIVVAEGALVDKDSKKSLGVIM